jgi:hypothetical protein
MIYIISIHAGGRNDPPENGIKFLDTQLAYLKRFTNEPFFVYCGIDETHREKLEQIINKANGHFNGLYKLVSLPSDSDQPPYRLNYLYKNLLADKQNFNDDDLIVFMDCDAWGLSGWSSTVRAFLNKNKNKMVAVLRLENPDPMVADWDKPYPHPCFVATTANFWKENYPKGLKWGWNSYSNEFVTSEKWLLQMKHWFSKNHYNWIGLTRTNAFNLHPVNFGVYGDIVYHHGAGTRLKYDGADIWLRPRLDPSVDLDLRYPSIPAFNEIISDVVYETIRRDPTFINIYLLGKTP